MLLAVAVLVSSAAAQDVPGLRTDAGRAGWDAIRDGRNQDAADAFAKAIAAEPRDPYAQLGFGLASYLLGRATVAREALERALMLSPSLTAASLLLGDILYRASDIGGAIRVYEAALRYAPDDGTLTARLETLRNEAARHREFFQSQGSHFTVLFEGPTDEALARTAIEMLEAAHWRIATALATYPDRVITVVLYTQEQFRDITRSPSWAAGTYDGRIRVPVGGIRSASHELERVLTHELTHALVQSVAPRGVPVWLHEGLAVLFEPEGDAWAAAQLARTGRRLPMQRLAGSFAGLSGADARLAYAQSAVAARSVIDHAGAAAVVAILQDIAAGSTFEAALERRLFLSYEAFLATLDTMP